MTDKDVGWIAVGAFFIAMGAGFLTGIGAFIIAIHVLENIQREKDDE